MAHMLPYSYFGPHHVFGLIYGFASIPPTSLAPVSSFPAHAFHVCPHSSVGLWYRNFNLLSIDYASLPRLRPRLPQGRSALPWNPWIFGRKDSHLPLATHSGILSPVRSTPPYGSASSRTRCSSTNGYAIPGLRQCVSAPDIFGAGPLD